MMVVATLLMVTRTVVVATGWSGGPSAPHVLGCLSRAAQPGPSLSPCIGQSTSRVEGAAGGTCVPHGEDHH